MSKGSLSLLPGVQNRPNLTNFKAHFDPMANTQPKTELTKPKPSIIITRRTDPRYRQFPHGLQKPKSPQNPPSLIHRLARVHSPNSDADSLLTRRTRRRVETRPHPPPILLFPNRHPSPTRLPTRSPTRPRLGRVNRVSGLGDFPSRPGFNPSAFNLGNS